MNDYKKEFLDKIIQKNAPTFIFSENDIADILDYFQPTFFKKGDVFVEKGALNRKIGFIFQGLFRLYYTKDSGDEISNAFPYEGYLLGSYECIVFNQPSTQTYQALEDSIVLLTDYDKLIELYDKNSRIERFGRIVAEHYIGIMQMRIADYLIFSPEQRYINLLSEFPEIVQRVSLNHIASALGITPVSLSRIRKRIADKKH